MPRRVRWVAVLFGLLALLGCAPFAPIAPAPVRGVADAASDQMLIVAVAERKSLRAAIGATSRADYRAAYAGSDEALAEAAAIADEFRFREVAAWTIAPLSLRCMLFQLAPGSDRAAVIEALAKDPRVRLVQPLHQFETLADAPPEYDDPYLGLQRGLLAIGALPAQRVAQGERVTVAVIDGAVDLRHPELFERVRSAHDYVGGAAVAGDEHGTAVAGVIAANARNGLGIVGVAPRAELIALRACWAVAGQAGMARCNSFTLAQAVVAAIAADADVINLSLGGPRDALLEQLVAYAQRRGVVVVGALPASGRLEGFPSAVPGVLVAAAVEQGAPSGTLAAPGRGVLSLAPDARYAYHSGSSMAAAHLSGAVALLKSIDRRTAASDASRLLAPATGGGPIDLCRAAHTLRPQSAGSC